MKSDYQKSDGLALLKRMVGPIPAMIRYLRGITGDDEEVRWAHDIATEIEAHVNCHTPVDRLAFQLGAPPKWVAEMAALARVKIINE
jgi:hypothetical protein